MIRTPLIAAMRHCAIRTAMVSLLSVVGCTSYVYLPPETAKRLLIERGIVVSKANANGTATQQISAEAINQALNSEQVRVIVPSDVTQAALLLPPASFDEAFRNLAWKCTSVERKRLIAADAQYVTFLGLLAAGLTSSTVAATFSGLAEIPTEETTKTALRASGIVMGGLAVIFNSLMAATAVRKNASATRSKYGEAQLALGEAQAEWPQVEDSCRARLMQKSGTSADKAGGTIADKEPPPQGEDDPKRGIAMCVSEKRRQILLRLSSRCLTEAEIASGD